MKKFIIVLSVMVLTLFLTYNYTHDNKIVSQKYNNTPYSELSKQHKTEIDCLATNIYREAGIEETRGMIAVALVTMNRLKAQGFPDSVCKVVKQKTKSTCQFSWVCMHKLPRIDEKIYTYTREIAKYVFLNHDKIDDFTSGALFYHADYVKPKWKNLEVTTKIGRHIFYKPLEI